MMFSSRLLHRSLRAHSSHTSLWSTAAAHLTTLYRVPVLVQSQLHVWLSHGCQRYHFSTFVSLLFHYGPHRQQHFFFFWTRLRPLLQSNTLPTSKDEREYRLVLVFELDLEPSSSQISPWTQESRYLFLLRHLYGLARRFQRGWLLKGGNVDLVD